MLALERLTRSEQVNGSQTRRSAGLQTQKKARKRSHKAERALSKAKRNRKARLATRCSAGARGRGFAAKLLASRLGEQAEVKCVCVCHTCIRIDIHVHIYYTYYIYICIYIYK